LMDIPLLGKIFSTKREDIEATEIVIFITPHIIAGDESYIEERDKLKPTRSFNEEEDVDQQQQALRIKK